MDQSQSDGNFLVNITSEWNGWSLCSYMIVELHFALHAILRMKMNKYKVGLQSYDNGFKIEILLYANFLTFTCIITSTSLYIDKMIKLDKRHRQTKSLIKRVVIKIFIL
jgi:hypothetical protein